MKNPTNRLCCAKNELTIGLVYTEQMRDTNELAAYPC